MVYVYIFQRFWTFVSYKHCLMVEKGDIVSNCPKQSETVSKMMSSHRRSLVRVYWEYICWFQKCFRQVLFVQGTFDPIFCHRGFVQQYNTLMTQLFGIFLVIVQHKSPKSLEDTNIKHIRPIFFLFLSVTRINPCLKQSDLEKSPQNDSL